MNINEQIHSICSQCDLFQLAVFFSGRFSDKLPCAIRYSPYQTSEKLPKVTDIGLLYDTRSGLFQIDANEQWKWRDPHVPLNMPSESGQPLTENERLELVEKLRFFVAKHPKKYEPFVGV